MKNIIGYFKDTYLRVYIYTLPKSFLAFIEIQMDLISIYLLIYCRQNKNHEPGT